MICPKFSNEYKESIREDFIKDFYKGLTNRQLGEVYFGGNISQAKKYIEKLRDYEELPRTFKKPDDYPDPIEVYEAETEDSKLQAGVYELYKHAHYSKRRAITERNKTEVLKNLVRKELITPLSKHNPPKINYNPERENLVLKLILSDMHTGQVIKDEDSGGLELFNTKILSDRVLNLIRCMKKYHLELDNYYNIMALEIDMIGDFTEGETIYQNQGMFVELPRIEQMLEAIKHLQLIVDNMIPIFPKIRIRCVRGNHGRPSLKGATHYKTSWDDVTYHQLKALFSNEKSVEFYISQSTEMLYTIPEIPDYNFLILHGDNTRINNLKKIRDDYSAMYRQPIDYIFMGHYHHCRLEDVPHGCVMINGAFTGGNSFSKDVLKVSNNPKQLLLGITSEGITKKYDIILEKGIQTRLAPKINGVFTPIQQEG